MLNPLTTAVQVWFQIGCFVEKLLQTGQRKDCKTALMLLT